MFKGIFGSTRKFTSTTTTKSTKTFKLKLSISLAPFPHGHFSLSPPFFSTDAADKTEPIDTKDPGMQREAEREDYSQKQDVTEGEVGGSSARKLGQRSREVWVAQDVMKEKGNVVPGNREEGREINKRLAGTALGDDTTVLRNTDLRNQTVQEGPDTTGQRM